MRKRASLLMLMLLLLLSACGGPGADGGRERVTIALWSDQLTERYAPYLQERFPEVDFTFYTATNSTDFYRFKYERDDLPDILTVRRFALRDVADWKDALMDLSGTELAGTFHQSYLRSYTYDDGTVNWLPACAEVDGLVVNKTLLEDNGLSLPATYQEFVDLCAALKEKGIRPFRSNFGADYTCMELLQGLCVERLTSQAGREWRQQYESGQTDRLSEEVWLPIFERMAAFIDCTGIGASELTDSTSELFASYQSGETAMIRGTPGEAAVYGVTERSVLLPYLGETEEDSWYLTYPAFQVAGKAAEDPARRQLILDIMAAMLDEEGLRHIADGETLIAYHKGVAQTVAPILAPMEGHIEDNRLYIRLASSDMFSASKAVVQGMLSGEYSDARAAFEDFNDWMNLPGAGAKAPVHVDAAYPYAFDPKHGSQAASAVLNSVREEVGAQLLIGPASAVAGNVAAGDYSEAQLGFLTMGESPAIVLCEMTGGQLYQYVDYVLTTPGKRGSVINDSTLYVSSGFEMELKRTEGGYALERLTIGGKELDRAAVYTVAALGNLETMVGGALESVGVTEYTRAETAYKQLVADRLAGGGQLAQPTDYITLR